VSRQRSHACHSERGPLPPRQLDRGTLDLGTHGPPIVDAERTEDASQDQREAFGRIVRPCPSRRRPQLVVRRLQALEIDVVLPSGTNANVKYEGKTLIAGGATFGT
jgi:hypothetical protein